MSKIISLRPFGVEDLLKCMNKETKEFVGFVLDSYDENMAGHCDTPQEFIRVCREVFKVWQEE